MTGPQSPKRCPVTYVYNLENRGPAVNCERLLGFGYGRIRWTEPARAVAR